MNITKSNIEEYAVGYPNAQSEYQQNKWNKYEAEKIVKERISNALEKRGVTGAHFSVRMMEVNYSHKVTRVYGGGWMWGVGGRSRTNKSFIQSKRNEAIDLDRAVEFIMEKEAELNEAKQAYDVKALREQNSRENADALNEEFGLDYGNLRAEPTYGYSAEGEQVVVSFKKQLSVEAARELIKVLKQYA